MDWTVELLDSRVKNELEALPFDIQARFQRIVTLIEGYGLERLREPHLKHVEGPIWEMRMKGKDGISRAMYVTARGRRVVVVRVFIKKTQKTPRREIDIALRSVCAFCYGAINECSFYFRGEQLKRRSKRIEQPSGF